MELSHLHVAQKAAVKFQFLANFLNSCIKYGGEKHSQMLKRLFVVQLKKVNLNFQEN